MNQNTAIIPLDSNSDLPCYTIPSKINIEAKYIRQTSSMDCFAIAELEIKPYEDKNVAIFKNQIIKIDTGYKILYPQKDLKTDTIDTVNTINKGIIEGIKKACLNIEKKTYLIGGIEVTATYAVYHPIDSRPYCYEMAVYIALLKVFNEIDLVKF